MEGLRALASAAPRWLNMKPAAGLRMELNVEPEPETLRLYVAIKNGELGQKPAASGPADLLAGWSPLIGRSVSWRRSPDS